MFLRSLIALLFAGVVVAQPVPEVKRVRLKAGPTPAADDSPERTWGFCLMYRTRKDYDRLFPLATKGAMSGNVKLMELLGELYHRGEGTPRDDAESARWYERAAAKDSYVAMLELGRLLVRGEGVPHDPATAETWFRKCIEAAGRGGATFVIEDAQKELGLQRPARVAAAPRSSQVAATGSFESPYTIGEELHPRGKTAQRYQFLFHNDGTGSMKFAIREKRADRPGFSVRTVTYERGEPALSSLVRTGFIQAWCTTCNGQGDLAGRACSRCAGKGLMGKPIAAPRTPVKKRFKLGEEFHPRDAAWITYKFTGQDDLTGVMTFAARKSRRARNLQGYDVWTVTLRERDPEFQKLQRAGTGRAWCWHCGGQGYISVQVAKQGGFASVNGRPDIVGWQTAGGEALSVCDSCAGNGLQ